MTVQKEGRYGGKEGQTEEGRRERGRGKERKEYGGS